MSHRASTCVAEGTSTEVVGQPAHMASASDRARRFPTPHGQLPPLISSLSSSELSGSELEVSTAELRADTALLALANSSAALACSTSSSFFTRSIRRSISCCFRAAIRRAAFSSASLFLRNIAASSSTPPRLSLADVLPPLLRPDRLGSWACSPSERNRLGILPRVLLLLLRGNSMSGNGNRDFLLVVIRLEGPVYGQLSVWLALLDSTISRLYSSGSLHAQLALQTSLCFQLTNERRLAERKSTVYKTAGQHKGTAGRAGHMWNQRPGPVEAWKWGPLYRLTWMRTKRA